MNDCLWEYFKKNYWTPPQGFYILINVYRFFKFSILGRLFQHGTLQQIMSNESSLYMTQLAGKQPNNFQELSKLTKQISISTT